MEKKGTKTKGESKSKEGKGSVATVINKKANGDVKVVVPEPDAALVQAKKLHDEAKAKLQRLKKQVRKDQQKMKNAPKRIAKLKEQIQKAKVGTTKSPEQLIEEAKKFEAEIAKLESTHKDTFNVAVEISEEEQELKNVLAEIRADKRTSGGSVDPGVVGRRAGKKAALIKALARRVWIVKYDSEGVATGAEKEGRVITFEKDQWTIEFDGKKESFPFGAGAIQKVDGYFPKADEDSSAEAKKAS